MAPKKETRTCLSCNKPVTGRSDKKFCDDYCRITHNNNLKSSSNNLIRNINNALLKNRRALETLLQENGRFSKVRKEELLHMGFQFKYHTHIYTTKKGEHYFFCYEYGYLPIDADSLLIVKKKDYRTTG